MLKDFWVMDSSIYGFTMSFGCKTAKCNFETLLSWKPAAKLTLISKVAALQLGQEESRFIFYLCQKSPLCQTLHKGRNNPQREMDVRVKMMFDFNNPTPTEN